jgi:hypothetical protein
VPVGPTAGDGGGDEGRHLDLDGIGVLELVEQQPLVAPVQRRPRLGAGPDQPAGQDEEVVEVEHPLRPALVGGRGGEAGEPGGELAQDLVDRLLDDPPGHRADLVDGGPGGGDVVPRRP